MSWFVVLALPGFYCLCVYVILHVTRGKDEKRRHYDSVESQRKLYIHDHTMDDVDGQWNARMNYQRKDNKLRAENWRLRMKLREQDEGLSP